LLRDCAGYYHFSVLDNGVISSEYWRIVDVADDLSWAIFYYSGAASVVGQTYQVTLPLLPRLLSARDDGRAPSTQPPGLSKIAPHSICSATPLTTGMGVIVLLCLTVDTFVCGSVQGSVFATPDGLWPDEKHLPRIEASMDSAGIKLWELYDVDQSCCDPEEAPLDVTDMRPFEPLV
jgi:hypothetical protein